MRVSKANHRQYNDKTKRTNNDLYKILHRKLKIEQRNRTTTGNEFILTSYYPETYR